MSSPLPLHDAPGRYSEAERFLAGLDADWQALVETVGPCVHQPRPERDPYEALVRAVVYQQLHTRAADRILQRLLALYPHGRCPAPDELLATPVDALRACGLSGAKTASILGLAQARLDGRIPDQQTAVLMPDQELIHGLSQLRGIGRWTVEMMLIYTLEREDILPADDFGVREGYRRLKKLEQAPAARVLRELGQAWSPYRSLAAWYLWRVPRIDSTPYATQAQRWQAIVERDSRADAHFVYAVLSTGTYASPSAAARRPKQENVRYFDTPEQAQQAGFRPSRHRHADRRQQALQHQQAVTQACRLIEDAENAPSLDELAAAVGMSPYHFHRIFKAQTGLTPRAYAQAHRARRLRRQLDDPRTRITDAIYEAGYGAQSRFYEESQALLGMPASAFRKAGQGATIRFAIAQCSLGALLVAESERGICAISLGDDPELLLRELQDRFQAAELIGADPGFNQRVAQVVALAETPSAGLALPLDIRGTAFQQRVWEILRSIPAGQTVTYTEIAQRMGQPRAVRAVARACATNALAVAIPCHRVVRQDGDLAGYRWGLDRKRSLLERERS
ncbi:bifunctional DNA-binding transcriptional regulator/O6-methylguanine-DNA methyltransferase Ada [Alcaligenes sp. Marseille-Q7550]